MAETARDSYDLVADEFEKRIEAVAVLATAALSELERLPWEESADFQAEVRRLNLAGRADQARCFRAGRLIPDACRALDVEAIHLSIRVGLSLEAVLRIYRISHAFATDAWLMAVEAASLDQSDRLGLARTVVRFCDAYDDRVEALVSAEYGRTRRCDSEDRDRRSLRIAMEIIRGTIEWGALDYSPDQNHIAVIAWGAEARRAVNDFSRLLETTPMAFFVGEDRPLMWAWVGTGGSISAAQRDALRRFRTPPGTSLAIGTQAPGVTGFRRSHREAGEAYVVAQRSGDPVTFFDDVAAEAFSMRDLHLARQFADAVLAPLTGMTAGAAELRVTLRAYFAAGQNTSAAAAALGVHEQTVARRLTAIERQTGATINSRRTSFELALSLEALTEPVEWRTDLPRPHT